MAERISRGMLERKAARLADLLNITYTTTHGEDGLYLEHTAGVGYRLLIFQEGREQALITNSLPPAALWWAIELAEKVRHWQVAALFFPAPKATFDQQAESETLRHRYSINEVYTPSNTEADRERREAEFETDATDRVGIALAGLRAIGWSEDEISIARHEVVNETSGGGTDDGFSMLLTGHHGDYSIDIERTPSG